MAKITYLFGAGASCGAMPLNIEIPERLEEMIGKLVGLKYASGGEEFDKMQDLLSDLKWLLKESKNHASIDTYAKKLYIKKKWKELKRLRLAISIFFTLEQIDKIPDKRYDGFFASIISDSISSLPSHINILNWNYDFQFELSFMSFADLDTIPQAQEYLRCIGKYKNYFVMPTTNFEIFKLNGDISLRSGNIDSDTYPIISNFNRPLDWEVFKEIVNVWDNRIKHGEDFCSNISFAWERSGSALLDYAANRLQDTEILVVIGYSFPYFNREIDKKLLSLMKTLRKVYFQAPDADDLEERFKALETRDGIELVKRFDKLQFLIPNEL